MSVAAKLALPLDAGIGAWAINQQLLAAGWTQTSDTGQQTFTSTKPAVGALTSGYNMYAFGDTLQATVPFFLRVAFYAVEGHGPSPGIVVQVGQTTDGAGNFTGSIATDSYLLASNVSTGTVGISLLNCWISADTARCTIALWNGSLFSASIFFSLERTKNSSGTDTNEGVLFMGYCAEENLSWCQALIAGDDVYEANTCWPAAFNQAQDTMASGNNLGYAYPICYNIRPYPYGLNTLIYQETDFTIYKTFPITVYGESHTYLALNNEDYSPTIPQANTHVLMRFE
jgi:hypothetical protein